MLCSSNFSEMCLVFEAICHSPLSRHPPHRKPEHIPTTHHRKPGRILICCSALDKWFNPICFDTVEIVTTHVQRIPSSSWLEQLFLAPGAGSAQSCQQALCAVLGATLPTRATSGEGGKGVLGLQRVIIRFALDPSSFFHRNLPRVFLILAPLSLVAPHY